MKRKALLILFLVVPLLALATGSALLYRVSYVLGLLVALGYLWSRWNVRGLKAEVRRLTPEVQAGQWLEEMVVVHNQSWLPKFLLEVHHLTDLPGHINRRVVHILPHSSATFVGRNLCQQRGLFSFGLVHATAQDPFGLFSRQVRIGQPGSILIYPATLEIPHFLLPLGKVLGEGYLQGRTDRTSPEAMGVREYTYGESYSRIHWRSTARIGKLMVKDFDREPAGPSAEVWLMLDMQASVQEGQGVESTAEYAITIAASIAKKYLDANRAVGLAAYGERHYVLPADRGNQQWGRLWEALALVQAQGQLSLAEAVSSTLNRMGLNALAVVITSASKESLVAPFALLGERGIPAVAILLDGASFGGHRGSAPAVDWLASAGVEGYVIRKGEEMEKALDSRVQGWTSKYSPVSRTRQFPFPRTAP